MKNADVVDAWANDNGFSEGFLKERADHLKIWVNILQKKADINAARRSSEPAVWKTTGLILHV